MDKLNLDQISYIKGMMESLQIQHPKAEVVWDGERVLITYPVPKDVWNIKKIGLDAGGQIKQDL